MPIQKVVSVGLLFLAFWSRAQTGPGGVGTADGSSSLMFWIDSDRGRTGSSPIGSIADLSGIDVQCVIGGAPTYVPASWNGHGLMRFDGSGDQIQTDATINAIAFPDLTVFAVYAPRTQRSGSVWGEDNGEWDRFLTDIDLVSTLIESVGAGYDPGSTSHPCNHIPNLFQTGVPTIASATYQDDVYEGTFVRINGVEAARFTSSVADYQSTGYSNFFVAAIGSNGFRFDGDIAEVFVYGDNVNEAEQLMIENYLSAKYDIALDPASDIYFGDDDGFDYDVAGIGRTNAANILSDARGTGLVEISSPSDLNDNEYLMWGHNGASLDFGETSDVPTSVVARSSRVWQVSEQSSLHVACDVGTVTMRFYLSDLPSVDLQDVRLLFDSDSDGLFGDETPVGGGVDLGNGVLEFSSVSQLVDFRRFTIAQASQVLPLHIVNFSAHLSDDSSVMIQWSLNDTGQLDRFELARSTDGRQWETIEIIASTGLTTMRTKDQSPIWGKNYYRIREVDLTGEVFLTEVVVVEVQSPNILVVPNPCRSTCRIAGAMLGRGEIEIFDSAGIRQLDWDIHVDSSGMREIDVHMLPAGHYLLELEGVVMRFVKQ